MFCCVLVLRFEEKSNGNDLDYVKYEEDGPKTQIDQIIFSFSRFYDLELRSFVGLDL